MTTLIGKTFEMFKTTGVFNCSVFVIFSCISLLLNLVSSHTLNRISMLSPGMPWPKYVLFLIFLEYTIIGIDFVRELLRTKITAQIFNNYKLAEFTKYAKLNFRSNNINLKFVFFRVQGCY